MNILQICKALKSLWKEGHKKEAWFLYVSVLQLSKDGPTWWKFDPWQHYDIIGSFYHGGGCFRRVRGGSKTRDLSAIAPFLRICVGPVIWFAPTRKQLMKAQEYWTYNPFVERFTITINRQYLRTVEFDLIEIAVLSEDNAKGPRGCVVIYDEAALMDRHTVESTRGITNGMGPEIFFYYGSTPIINTMFQDECIISPWERVHPFYHCSWMSIEKILKDRKSMMDAKWRQENLAHFTVMDGMVFEKNLHRADFFGKLESDMYYGVDPNPREGYIVVGGQFDYNQKIFVYTYCKDFGTAAEGKNAMLKFLLDEGRKLKTIGIELETNGVGKVIADDLEEMGGIFNAVDWDKTNKVKRVNDMLNIDLYIPPDQAFNKLWIQMNAVQWAEDGKSIQKTKGSPCHYSDSAIHACQYSGGGWLYI